MLAKAGIHSVDRLKELGAVEAFVLAKEMTPSASLNLLWAVEAALTGQTWQEVSRRHRASLLLALEDRLKRS
jgi:DNA transformation protein